MAMQTKPNNGMTNVTSPPTTAKTWTSYLRTPPPVSNKHLSISSVEFQSQGIEIYTYTQNNVLTHFSCKISSENNQADNLTIMECKITRKKGRHQPVNCVAVHSLTLLHSGKVFCHTKLELPQRNAFRDV